MNITTCFKFKVELVFFFNLLVFTVIAKDVLKESLLGRIRHYLAKIDGLSPILRGCLVFRCNTYIDTWYMNYKAAILNFVLTTTVDYKFVAVLSV